MKKLIKLVKDIFCECILEYVIYIFKYEKAMAFILVMELLLGVWTIVIVILILIDKF